MAAGSPITRTAYTDEINLQLKDVANSRMSANTTEATAVAGGTTTLFSGIANTVLTFPGSVGASELETVLSDYAKIFSRVRKVKYVIDGCGTTYFRYVRVDNTAPDSSYSAPDSTVFDSLEGDDVASWGAFISVMNSLKAVQVSNFEKLYTTVSFCHCSCHSSCHSSRGRR